MKIFARPVSLPLLVALVLSVVIWLLVITVAPVSGEITPLPLPVFSTDQHDGIELIENGSFEAKDSNGLPVLAGWTLTHPTHDKIKCSKPDQTSISHSGNCAFRF
ncbi:MAG TPA: hypothetical protein VHL11_10895, partial [Phototrophicaceae bacterium]|nr:hypothetical protein [Phototrophicaceae bacterium]